MHFLSDVHWNETCRVQLAWPTLQAEVQRRGVAQKALLDSWLMNVHPNVFAAMSSATAVQVQPTSISIFSSYLNALD